MPSSGAGRLGTSKAPHGVKAAPLWAAPHGGSRANSPAQALAGCNKHTVNRPAAAQSRPDSAPAQSAARATGGGGGDVFSRLLAPAIDSVSTTPRGARHPRSDWARPELIHPEKPVSARPPDTQPPGKRGAAGGKVRGGRRAAVFERLYGGVPHAKAPTQAPPLATAVEIELSAGGGQGGSKCPPFAQMPSVRSERLRRTSPNAPKVHFAGAIRIIEVPAADSGTIVVEQLVAPPGSPAPVRRTLAPAF